MRSKSVMHSRLRSPLHINPIVHGCCSGCVALRFSFGATLLVANMRKPKRRAYLFANGLKKRNEVATTSRELNRTPANSVFGSAKPSSAGQGSHPRHHLQPFCCVATGTSLHAAVALHLAHATPRALGRLGGSENCEDPDDVEAS